MTAAQMHWVHRIGHLHVKEHPSQPSEHAAAWQRRARVPMAPGSVKRAHPLSAEATRTLQGSPDVATGACRLPGNCNLQLLNTDLVSTLATGRERPQGRTFHAGGR